MTFLLLGVVLGLFWLSGLGVTLVLFRQPGPVPRLLICPFLGLATTVLLFFVLVRFDLDGLQTGRLEVAVLGAFAIFGLFYSPLRRQDWREAGPVLACCLGALLLAAWPLLADGYRDYMGYGNPDVAFFLVRLRQFAHHPVRLDQPGLFRGLDPGGIVGVLAFILQLGGVTGAAVEDLFATLCGAILFLGPASVYLLCRTGLSLPQPVCVRVSAVSACSSLMAFSFYLHSLGTLTVVTTAPAILAAVLYYLRSQQARDAIAPALLLSGALYNYGQGFILMAVTCGLAVAAALVQRSLPARKLWPAGAICAAAAVLPSYSYLWSILNVIPTMSSPANIGAAANEIQTSFALVLTERAVPFFWGLNNPYVPLPRWFGSVYPLQLTLYTAAAVFFAITGLSFFERVSRLPATFRTAMAGAVLLLAYFQAQGVGYGVFKLTAWTHLLFLTAMAACLAGISAASRSSGTRKILEAVMFAYAIINAAHTVQLGRYSTGSGAGMLNNTPGLNLSDFRALKDMPRVAGMVMGAPDSVVRLWAPTFLGDLEGRTTDQPRTIPDLHAMAPLGLLVEDSEPMPFLPDCDDAGHMAVLARYNIRCSDLSQSFLDWKPGRDILATPGPGMWSSRVFALHSRIPAGTVVFGRGWYRPERVPDAEVAWQRDYFRWVRKRAELIVINPSPSARRLRLGMVSGFGYPSNERNVDILLNGKTIETLQVSSYREAFTKPFVVPGPVSQIELLVQETVEPLKRQKALWNRWVPADSRRLNVAIGRLALVDEAENAVPSAVDFEIAKGFWGTLTDGVLQDRWMSRRAKVELSVPADARYLEFRGFVPGVRTYSFPMRVEFYAGAEPLGSGEVKVAGDFQMRIPLAPSLARRLGRRATIEIRTPVSFRPSELGVSPDTRDLSIRVSSIGFGPR